MAKYKLFTTNEVKPGGWIKKQLEIQANGLSGNLDKVWRDVRDSKWIGKNAEGWERVPYWLDGFIPLAYLLENKDMINRAKKYIDAILSFQRESGWICPCTDAEIEKYDTWAVQLISKVLTVYYECSNDERIPAVLYKVLKNYYELLKEGKIKLFDWGKARWFECFISINLLKEIYNEDWLESLASILKEQGTDYLQLKELWKKPLYKWGFDTHIVNLVMMLKYEAVSHGILGDEYKNHAEELYDVLKTYNGTPVELFTGDECLSGLSPIQGTELCAVVEQMYSYELLYAYTGDEKWLERLEIIAFNALPATISDDMWAHQYDQMSNQISCEKFPGKPIFGTNFADAHLFGLEPNFGCCTANFNQGWPKFTLSAFMYDDSTIINTVCIPTILNSKLGNIELKTNYPFDNSFEYHIVAKEDFEFKIRIPSFAKNIILNGDKKEFEKMLSFNIKEGETKTITLSFESDVLTVERHYGLKIVKCGSLVFSLPIDYEKRMLEYEKDGVERKFPYCDYEYIGKSKWNYGYSDVDKTVIKKEVTEVPFSSEKPPVVVKARVAEIDWGLETGYEHVCSKIPNSTKPISEIKEVELYPYGCAKLRMTELPDLK